MLTMWRLTVGGIGRKAGSFLALIGYLLALTVGASAHCQALTRAALVPDAAGQHHAAEGHDGDAHHQAAAEDDGLPELPARQPSDVGCGLCQSCSPCGLPSLQSAGAGVPFAHPAFYRLPELSVPDGHLGGLPAEPPRA